ncbi:probable alpha-aspartyl dipeptidase [Battus philenor]|uniref:probable alpha-aspartyl dipeptidase n=1 Tax=Battus philenor TaxID=42288 RepID=UPI0035CEB5D0
MSRCQALLLSSSNCHGYSLLEFAKEEICNLLNKNNIKELLFVPFAQKNHEEYTNKIKAVISPWGYSVNGLHTHAEPVKAVKLAKAIFIGGGNTFLLLNDLYAHNLVTTIRDRVLSGKLVYIGSSAGTNVATKSIHTTNDMPIIYPPSFEAIGLVPFNINPHYIDKSDIETHKGETRDQRICEYMEMPSAKAVLGLREGSILHVDGNSLTLKGIAGAVLFQKGSKKIDYQIGDNLSFLMGE